MDTMSKLKFKARVAYVPSHVVKSGQSILDNLHNRETEFGGISSWNDQTIFVKFDKQVAKLGWEGTTSQGCYPEDLLISGGNGKWEPVIT